MSKNPRNQTVATELPAAEGLQLTEIQIWPVRSPETSRVKAMASLTFNGTIRVNSCRLIEGAKGMFLSYPSEKRQGTEEWVSFVHPITREANDLIQERVLGRYRELVMAA